MNDNGSDVEAMTLAVAKTVDAMLRDRPIEPLKVLAALGAAGGLLVGMNIPENDGEVDGVMMGALGLGFREMLESMRKAQTS